MTELFHSNRWIWQSETFWNCYSRRNGRLFQENLLLKATNTNNNPKMVAQYYMDTWDAEIAQSCSYRHWDRKFHHKRAPNFLRSCHTDEMQRIEMLWRFFLWKLLRIFGEICFNICVIVFLSITKRYLLYIAFGFNTTAIRFNNGFVELLQDNIAKTFGGPLWNSWCAILSTANVCGPGLLFKVPCTSGPFSGKIMNGYLIFSVQIFDHQVEQMHK